MSPGAANALMKFLSRVARKLGVGKAAYVVGGAVRNHVLGVPAKDLDLVIDPIATGRPDASNWFAEKLREEIPARTSLVTNNYGVAILTVSGDWILDGFDMTGEVIEIANARRESYGGEGGKGYKPHMVEPATIEEDVVRREFSFNTLMWRLHDLADGPDGVEIVDITGCGLRDLREGLMRCPSDPDKTFGDDPSRLLRVVKFTEKYGFRIEGETEAAIRRNVHKLRNVPPSHLGGMLLDFVLVENTARKALDEMDRLGLLDVLKEIVQEDKGLRNTLANHADQAGVAHMFTLMDFGIPSGKRLSFLTRAQIDRVRDVTVGLTASDAKTFVANLGQPKLDNMALMVESGLQGSDMGRVKILAREAMLVDPETAFDPRALTEAVRSRLAVRTASVDDVHYVGVILDPMDARRLIRRYGQRHPDLHTHHVTLWHREDPGDFPEWLPWGKTVEAKVTAHLADDKGQVVTVKIPSSLRGVSGRVPHVTLSTNGVGSRYSNTLVANGEDGESEAGHPSVRGRIAWVDGRDRVHFESPYGQGIAHRSARSSTKTIVDTLSMFDFDGTLFRSPEHPEWWEEVSLYFWGSNLLSLSPPCVPARPGPEFWNARAVSAAKKAMHDAGCMFVVVTGRTRGVSRRILGLLAQQGIVPDSFYPNTAGSAVRHKIDVFTDILTSSPDIVRVEIWENENLAVYEAAVTGIGRRLGRDILVVPRPVDMAPMPVECTQNDIYGESRTAGILAPDKLGIPSRHLRNVNYEAVGYLKDTKGPDKTRKPHALQDVEFYTRIADEIDNFVAASRKIPRKQWQLTARDWVLGRSALGGGQRDFFRLLKKEEHGKWQKAVNEFFKGVENKLGSLNSGEDTAMRVASSNSVVPMKFLSGVDRLCTRWVRHVASYGTETCREAALAPECRFDKADPSKKCPLSPELLGRIRKKYLGDVPPFRVWSTDGATIRNEVDIDHTNGGNPAVYGYVPDGEIWVEDLPSPKDMACTLLHELVETFLMQHLGLEYGDAHDLASKVENPLRETGPEIDKKAITSVAGTVYREWLHGLTARQMTACVTGGTPRRAGVVVPDPRSPEVWSIKYPSLEAWQEEWAHRVRHHDDSPRWKTIVRGMTLHPTLRLALAEKIVGGTATASDILGIVRRKKRGVGIWWFLADLDGFGFQDAAEYAWDQETLQDPHGIGIYNLEEAREGRSRTVDCALPVVFTGIRPPDWHPYDNPDAGPFQGTAFLNTDIWPEVQLTRISYYTGTQWFTVPTKAMVQL